EDGQLIIVAAPAGYGKTTLIADWLVRDGRSSSWLSLSREERDPIRFWQHVALALDRLFPGVSQRALTLLLGGPAAALDTSLTLLSAALAQRTSPDPDRRPAVLVLDDYHVIADRRIHDTLMQFIEALPPSVHLVLIGRSVPPLPLGRARARGQ